MNEGEILTILDKPNNDWWGEKRHNVSKAVFRPINSDPTRLAALLSGELDMMYPVPMQDIKRVKQSNNLDVLTGAENRSIFLGLDVGRDELLYSNIKGKNPFKDQRVRKAFYQAINIDAIIRTVMRGQAVPAKAAGLSPPVHIGGWGFCIGFGSKAMLLKET